MKSLSQYKKTRCLLKHLMMPSFIRVALFKQDKWIFSLFGEKYLTRTQVINYAMWSFR